jgi:hypothetical protein
MLAAQGLEFFDASALYERDAYEMVIWVLQHHEFVGPSLQAIYAEKEKSQGLGAESEKRIQQLIKEKRSLAAAMEKQVAAWETKVSFLAMQPAFVEQLSPQMLGTCTPCCRDFMCAC